MYQVGFGDCVLVSIEYDEADATGRAERHVLFDLGSTRSPRNGKATMQSVARLVAEHTHGRLDILAVTHRHKDHLHAFGVKAAAEILVGLKPRLVLRPWTEDPRLPTDATSPDSLVQLTPSARFAAALAQSQRSVERIAAASAARAGAVGELAAAATGQMPNADAVATLDALSDSGRGRYLRAGKRISVDRAVPGLRVTVLGPPTVDQSPEVANQVSRDPEYWMLRLHRSLAAAEPAAEPAPARAAVPPGPVRWLVENLQGQRTHSVARLVRALDDALNNTSLVLLLEIGGLTLLFPGDAQIENWRYTLQRLPSTPQLAAKLSAVDLYKVGHHGSRNATPRTLYGRWTQRPATAPRMTAIMSTRSGTHGETPATQVPRQTLVDALAEVADVYSTDDLPAERAFVELVADASGGPFTLVEA
ncbi:MAG: hypothetical protein ACXWW7_03920 [Nocardioides sp.]